jgi:hypothetical protein
METKFVLILISLVLQSCNSQSNFDLLKFPLDTKVEDLSLNAIEVKKGSYYLGMDYKTYKIYDSKFLRIGDLDVAGRIYPDKNYERNVVNFCFSKKDSVITSIEVNVYTQDEKIEFIKKLKETLGKPKYTSFNLRTTKKGEKIKEVNGYVWENLYKNKTYFFKLYKIRATSDPTFEEANLKIVSHSDEFLYSKILSSFQYYEDYIEERERKGDLNYTYQQFVKDETKGGRAQYYIHYSE